MKQTLYDRNEIKLIERIVNLRRKNPSIKVGEIKRPVLQDEVFECEVET